MKKKKLLRTLMLIVPCVITNLLVNAQDCSPGVWTCHYTPSGYYCGCADTNSIYGQICPPGQELACRLNMRCEEICECVDSGKVAKWLARSHKCGNNGQNPHWNWRSSEDHENFQYETLIEGVYHNPVYNSTSISFSLSRSQHVSLQVVDMSGRLTSTIADQVFEKGENVFLWDASEINAGMYFIRLETDEIVRAEKIIIAK
jgi:hypothetical protein